MVKKGTDFLKCFRNAHFSSPNPRNPLKTYFKGEQILLKWLETPNRSAQASGFISGLRPPHHSGKQKRAAASPKLLLMRGSPLILHCYTTKVSSTDGFIFRIRISAPGVAV